MKEEDEENERKRQEEEAERNRVRTGEEIAREIEANQRQIELLEKTRQAQMQAAADGAEKVRRDQSRERKRQEEEMKRQMELAEERNRIVRCCCVVRVSYL